MKAFPVAIFFFLAAASFMFAGCSGPATDLKTSETSAADLSNTPTPAIPGNFTEGMTGDRYANLTRFVDSAAVFAKERGREAALAAFNDPNGTYVVGELYIFAYDMNGTTLALPFQPAVIGTARKGLTDPNGVAFIDRMIELAREGGGSIYYIYPNAEDDYREEFKISYAKPIDGDWFIGAGIYMPELAAGFNSTERDELVDRVKRAREYALVQGAEKAIADFNIQNGSFADGNRYIFAYGLNGTTLALPFQPELIGTNRLNYTDTYGVKGIEWEISAAKRGGGFVYLDYLNPADRAIEMKLCYVEPVGDTWLVGSGIYTRRL